MAEEKKITKKRTTNNKTSKKTNTKKTDVKRNSTKKITPKKTNSVKTKKIEVEQKKEIPKKILESTTLPPNIDKTIIFNKEETKNIKEVMNTLEKETITKEKKEEKIQKILIMFLSLLLVITIILCTIYVAKGVKKENEVNTKETEPTTILSNVYKKVLENTKNIDLDNIKPTEETSEYSTIIPLNLTEFESKIISKENMVVLISKKSCYYCLTFEETIHDVLNTYNKKIYKLDIMNMKKEEIDRLREYYRFTLTPTIFKIEDGIVTSDLIEAQTKENFKNWVEENM